MKRILIVEDEPDIQELLRAYLEDAGYQTAVAGDGVAALALFGGQPFDLVLLDLMLPKIDGFGVCELIRQQSQIPILMLTALDGEESQLRGFGMDKNEHSCNYHKSRIKKTIPKKRFVAHVYNFACANFIFRWFSF